MKDQKKRCITRRDFIKKVGYTTGAIGISSAFPKLLRPARAASRDHILIGRPVPKTGPIAAFAESTPWLDNRALDEINRDGGIYIKEYGKKVPLKVKIMDTGSNPTKAAEIGSSLIVKDKIDMMYVSSTPATVNPVAGVCERYKVPSVSTMMPVEMFLHGGPYHWAFDASCSVPDMVASYLDSWKQVKTNKTVGLLAANDADGMSWAKGAQNVLKPAGYKVVDLGRFPGGTMDFSTFITGWKKEKVEILFANLAPPDFIRAWRQCHRQGFIPKICAIGRAVLFPSVVEALGGDIGLGTSTEVLWHPAFPFKSSLTGYSAQKLADAYEEASSRQWTQPIGGFYLGWEIVADVFRRAQTIDKETLRRAIADTNLDTIGGHIKFNDKNVAVTPVGLIQWVKGEKFPFDSKIVSKGNFPNVVTQAKLVSIQELRR
ncbi:MAG: ABC transporter substrate-binding protein [Desulfobacteraceae bacterium]|nr:ABC transporter substrate-binding protein [Desulfobacteraceae bacterium]